MTVKWSLIKKMAFRSKRMGKCGIMESGIL